MGNSRFSVTDVHNIGILDLRLFNLDRHGENILVVKNDSENFRLIPIDHAYTLPDKLTDAWFEWLYWPQAKKPFGEESLGYISSINIDRDSEILRFLGIGEKNIRTMRLSTLFMKMGAARGLTLFGIAEKVCRRIPSEESVLEKLVARAELSSGDFETEFGNILLRYFGGGEI